MLNELALETLNMVTEKEDTKTHALSAWGDLVQNGMDCTSHLLRGGPTEQDLCSQLLKQQ